MPETLVTPNATTPFPELHSEEVQEIIGRPPHWLIRWGITLFFVLTALLGVGTWCIRYPDIVSTPFILTATNAPRVIVVRTEGKLVKLLIRDGQHVSKGQTVAYSESTADPEQVVQLALSIEQISMAISKGEWASVNRFSNTSYSALGEIQSDFQNFNQQLTELKSFLAGGYFLQKQKLLIDDRNDLVSMERILAEQMVLQDKDLELARGEFQIQEKLHLEKVISTLEYKREKAKVLSREMPVKNLAAALIQNRSAQTGKQKELLELENLIQERKSNFIQSLQTLRSRIQNWKLRYAMTAPVAGIASFSAPWQEQQHLTPGQELMQIEPQSSRFQGLVKLPQANLGKVMQGQTVLIKLDGFPYREYGMLEGRLGQLSVTPGEDTAYWAYVDLPYKLKTRYGKYLPYRNGLKGTAEIVTADRRLLERLAAPIHDGGK